MPGQSSGFDQCAAHCSNKIKQCKHSLLKLCEYNSCLTKATTLGNGQRQRRRQWWWLFRHSRTLSAYWRFISSTPISYFCKGKLGQGLDCVLATCIAVAWVTPLQGGPQITPPLWHKEGCTAQCWAMGGATAKSCLSLFRGRDPNSTRLINVFYSIQQSLQSTKTTLCSPTPIQFPKNPISLLTIYPSSYCTFYQGKPRQGLQWL
jgi:hypothetical protein